MASGWITVIGKHQKMLTFIKLAHLTHYPIWEVEEGLELNLNISDAQLKDVVQNEQRS
jgi:hypothetical protein